LFGKRLSFCRLAPGDLPAESMLSKLLLDRLFLLGRDWSSPILLVLLNLLLVSLLLFLASFVSEVKVGKLGRSLEESPAPLDVDASLLFDLAFIGSIFDSITRGGVDIGGLLSRFISPIARCGIRIFTLLIERLVAIAVIARCLSKMKQKQCFFLRETSTSSSVYFEGAFFIIKHLSRYERGKKTVGACFFFLFSLFSDIR
jgi:hypothetical protein